jgi:membrane protein DedA with SNARE-associated domain
MLDVTQLGLALAIVFGALISEDAAVLGAATLSARSMLNPELALLSAVLGILLGDYALYLIARSATRGAVNWTWARKAIDSDFTSRCRRWTQKHGRSALFLSRAIPGMRLPVTLACGTLGMRQRDFVLFSIAGASVWVLGTFVIVHSSQQALRTAWPLMIAGVAFSLFAGRAIRSALPRLHRLVTKCSRWEFWPAWLFYFPVVAIYAWLALRYRGLSLPAAANPGQLNGGVVGESKAQILDELHAVAPDHVAHSFLIPAGENPQQRIFALLQSGHLSLPFVLKPNVGQRGAGFRIIRDLAQANVYLASVSSDVVAQDYAPGPHEAGIFYYRLPGETRGHILAITQKVFPTVCGDGRTSLRELIHRDDRAALIASTYLKRLEARADEIIPFGDTVRLVEAGNHCQGCIFQDGVHLYSDDLLDVIDRISRALPEFYIGRYDVRYVTDDELRAGRFTIIELNGAASEATSIYDARNSLSSAYRMLYRQWDLVFQIGRRNRDRGFRGPTLLELFHSWRDYCRISAAYPIAD